MPLDSPDHATMFMRYGIAAAIALNTILSAGAAAEERFTLDLETAAAWQLRNDFAVPGETGTLVRLDEAPGRWG